MLEQLMNHRPLCPQDLVASKTIYKRKIKSLRTFKFLYCSSKSYHDDHLGVENWILKYVKFYSIFTYRCVILIKWLQQMFLECLQLPQKVSWFRQFYSGQIKIILKTNGHNIIRKDKSFVFRCHADDYENCIIKLWIPGFVIKQQKRPNLLKKSYAWHDMTWGQSSKDLYYHVSYQFCIENNENTREVKFCHRPNDTLLVRMKINC